MTRGGRTRDRTEPVRRCAVTRAELPKARLLRFVIGPEDQVVPDLAGRLPGRGIYVSAEREVLAQAVGKGIFSRAARRKVHAAPELPAEIERMLAARLTDTVALARKAGQAIAGREKTLAALRAGEAVLLLQASDGSAREMAGVRPPSGPESRICCLSACELGMAFGRDRVIHAAVLAGGLSDRIYEEALRLSGFREQQDRQMLGDEAGVCLAGEGLREKG